PASPRPEYIRASGVVPSPDRLFNWPVTVSKAGAGNLGSKINVTFYEPQISKWKNYDHLSAWMAVSITGSDFKSTRYGVIQLEGDTTVNFSSRNVHLYNISIGDVLFPKLQGKKLKKLVAYVSARLLEIDRPVSLDLMLASIADSQAVKTTKINTQAPEIYFSVKPTVLLLIDGKALVSPIKGADNISFVVNTNWDLYQENSSNSYYLLHGDRWFRTSDLNSLFSATDSVPDQLRSLPKDGSWKQTLDSLPAKPWGSLTPPRVLLSRNPAELIVTDGQPELKMINDTRLSYVTNTTNDLFKYGETWYFLVAGRWFSTQDLNGQWTYATAALPEEFGNIPDDHLKAHALSSVPGTIQAQLAITKSQIPVKARIKRSARVDVTYAGEPKFETIFGTKLRYAMNTSYDIVEYKNNYFLCYEGVWFRASSAKGLFKVASAIPSEIYDIPSNHPLYHVTFVTIYEADEKTVTTGYTSGYHHHYVYGGALVWGTGWYYPPYYYYDGYYPYYYYYPYTYGVAAGYNPATGTYARRAEVYGPYGGYGRAAAYNENTGTFARSAYVWDSDQGYGVGQAYNPRTGTSLVTQQGYDDYDRWGETVVTRGDEWAHISKTGDERGTRRDIETSRGGKGTVITGEDGSVGIGRSGEGDIYASKDGNIYKRDDNGWYKREDGEWSQVDQSKIDAARDNTKQRVDGGITSETISKARANANQERNLRTSRSPREETHRQLQRDRNARTLGRQRNQTFQRRSGSFGGGLGRGRGLGGGGLRGRR
ncbi:MAG: hypothetical protein JKY88_11405, partial [Pseudomonadales bacterium]|nr:hypothetical protein [Pseudomonadales bacterium]